MKKLAVLFAVFMLTGIHHAMAERLSTAISIAKIRSGPGSEYDILWEVSKYCPIQIIKQQQSWYYFRDFEGDTGWIYYTNVDKTPSIVTTTTSNIRSGPGTDYDILGTVPEGICFKILERKGDWIYTLHEDGDKGWIHKSLVW